MKSNYKNICVNTNCKNYDWKQNDDENGGGGLRENYDFFLSFEYGGLM